MAVSGFEVSGSSLECQADHATPSISRFKTLFDELTFMKKGKYAKVIPPLRTQQLYEDAEYLREKKSYVMAMLSYTLFVEQLLLVRYLFVLRNGAPIDAKNKMDEILKIKDKRKLTFGKVLQMVDPKPSGHLGVSTPELSTICQQLKNIRNALLAHPYFVIQIDPHNKFRLGFYDINNYRKVIRRLYGLMQYENLPSSDRNAILSFLHDGSPLSRMSNLEQDAMQVEEVILVHLCKLVCRKTKKAKQILESDVASQDQMSLSGY